MYIGSRLLSNELLIDVAVDQDRLRLALSGELGGAFGASTTSSAAAPPPAPATKSKKKKRNDVLSLHNGVSGKLFIVDDNNKDARVDFAQLGAAASAEFVVVGDDGGIAAARSLRIEARSAGTVDRNQRLQPLLAIAFQVTAEERAIVPSHEHDVLFFFRVSSTALTTMMIVQDIFIFVCNFVLVVRPTRPRRRQRRRRRRRRRQRRQRRRPRQVS